MNANATALACLLSLAACTHTGEPREARNWVMELRPVAGVRPMVPEYEVEFLPMLPADPRAFIVGKFHIRNGAALNLSNEAMVQAIKRRAAGMGGNTIIYPDTAVKEAMVAYVPPDPVNMHGGDEAPEPEAPVANAD